MNKMTEKYIEIYSIIEEVKDLDIEAITITINDEIDYLSTFNPTKKIRLKIEQLNKSLNDFINLEKININ
jgi:hypothetical protein